MKGRDNVLTITSIQYRTTDEGGGNVLTITEAMF